MSQQRLTGESLMERTQPHSWLDVGLPFQHAAASHLPATAIPQPTVIVCDPKGTHHQLISRVVSECGASPRWVNDFFAIPQIESSGVCNLAMVGLGACPSPGDHSLETIHSLKRKGFNIICYEDGTRSWSLGTRCLVLLAGASCLLDSAAMDFSHELRRALAHLLQGEAQPQIDEENIRGTMQQLGIVGE